MNLRCSICNCTDTALIATSPEDYIPGLKFHQDEDGRGYTCFPCQEEINENLGSISPEDDTIILDDISNPLEHEENHHEHGLDNS